MGGNNGLLTQARKAGRGVRALPCVANGAADMGKRKTKATGDNAGSGEYPRPVWVDDGSAAEMPNFAPSPSLYFCACSFVWAEARNAYLNGDYSLLARAGIADALEFIINPNNAGTDGAAYSEMLDDWRLFMSAKNARAENYRIASMISADIPRIDFWRNFDADADRDADALGFRRKILTERHGELLRLALKLKENGELDLYNALTDSFFSNIDTANPEPARVRAYWLNDAFSLAGEEMARWLSVATLPNYEKQIAELRARIAENFGVFPAPFECVADGAGGICTPRNVILLAAKIHELNGDAGKADKARKAAAKIPTRHYLRLAGDELTTLLHIARAQARQAAHGARLPDVPASRHERATGADGGGNETRLNPHARTLISDYKPNVSFYLRTEKGNTLINDLSPKQWESARFLLEGNADADGWVKMPDGWKRPQRWTGKQAAFWARVHSKLLDGGNGDGVGYFRIERLPATSKRGGKRANAGRGTRSPR